MKDEIIIYQANQASTRIEVRIEDESVWLSQGQMAELFLTTSQNITIHIKNIYLENELQKESTCKEYLQVQLEGKRSINRKIIVYNLDMILSVGYRIKSILDSHDRFIIIDNSELYHIGASLKDLGKKWFAFSRFDSLAESLLNMLKE